MKHFVTDSISKLKTATEGIKVDHPESATINECETCALIKVHKIIFRRPGHEETAETSFQRVEFDMIQQNTTYNEDN